jgi:integrase
MVVPSGRHSPIANGDPDRARRLGAQSPALLVATYGLRTSEIAALRLDDVEWRAGRIRGPRRKTRTPIVPPMMLIGLAIRLARWFRRSTNVARYA